MIAHINNKKEEQTVSEHVRSVAKLAEERATTIGLTCTMRLTGLLHDIGKETQAFDQYIRNAFQNPKSVRRGEINHSSAGGKYIFEAYGKDSSMKGLTSQLISTAIFSHHGLIDCLKIDGTDKFLQRVQPQSEIYYEEAIGNNRDLFREYDIEQLFYSAVEEVGEAFERLKKIVSDVGGKEPRRELHFLIGCLERLMLSILLDADRTDTARFMTELVIKEQSPDELQELWNVFQKRLNNKLGQFQGQDPISKLRKKMSAECLEFGTNESGIYCLPIPTGGGKTLCSLRFALEHAQKQKKKRIVYVAPFLSILEKNADVIRDILQADGCILEHHSNIIQEENVEESQEETNLHQLLIDTWESPIILTTMVQFLNTLFSSKTQCIRRMHQLQDSIIIIDEIQSLPIKCVYMFNMMMNFLSFFCNTTVVLCSATQPLLHDVEKRILYSQPKNMIKDVEMLANCFKRVHIRNSIISGGYDTKMLVAFISSNFQKNVLIILNTKGAVGKLYEELKNTLLEDNIYLVQLTTYMCAQHRSDVIKELKKRLSKPKQRVICISTQLIEAGVDISFQCVIRSVAGLDSIMQAAGRCNRNGNKEGQLGQVHIINYKKENISSLTDIREAKEATETLLGEFERNQRKSEDELLSIQAMNRYYELYFWKRRDEMWYPISKDKFSELGENITLYDLLSSNQTGDCAYNHQINDGKMKCLPMKQAFKQAGDFFEVIGSETVALIVPYKKAKQLIKSIQNTRNPKEIYKILKQLQRYTVNVFKTDTRLKQLDKRGAIDTSVLDGTIYILSESFYKEDIGVSDELQLQIF